MNDDAKAALESGKPPDWFPPDKQIDFRSKRRILLTCMPLDDLTVTLQDVMDMHRDHFANLKYWEHSNEPATINGVPDTVGHASAILARYLYAAELGEKKGLPLLLGKEHAGRVKKGDAYGKHQAKIASNPRGKIGDEEETNDQLIGNLALAMEYREYSAKELWPVYWGALDDRVLKPRETEADDWRKSVIEYDSNNGRKAITGGQFANVVSDYRTGKKSG